MVRKSLQASQAGIQLAERALISKRLTQKDLANQVDCSIQPIQKFFKGKPIAKDIFVKICTKLGLDWEEIADLPKENEADEQNQQNSIDIDALVKQVRDKIRTDIEQYCGTMRVLDMTQPIGLSDIYTDVNILEKLTSSRPPEKIDKLMEGFDPDADDFDRRGLGKITEERVPGQKVVKRCPRLMVLGKPGAGKTTFLKYLAIQCIQGEFLAQRVPIFITLKDFAEAKNQPDLQKLINQRFADYGFTETQTADLFKHGRILILLDGLDEVREKDEERVLRQIRDFSHKLFFSEQFISDRISWLDKKQEAEEKIKELNKDINYKTQKIQDYNRELKDLDSQLKNHKKSDKDEKTDEKAILKKIQEIQQMLPKLQQVIPIEREEVIKLKSEYPDISSYPDQGLEFFSKKFPEKIYSNHFVITCRIAASEYKFDNFTEVEVADFNDLQIQVFSQKWFKMKNPPKGKIFWQKLSENNPVKDLASNPLLLTLLCLVFEESTDFPLNRSELYKEGVSILIKKWDAQRNIERDQIYKNLSPTRKEDLLSQVAWTTFERGDYFFKQRDIERYIADYISNLPDAKTDPEALKLDSEVVLKSIEAQHGLLVGRARSIYSFSHLTFQEYFAARKIVTTSKPQALEKDLQSLSNHINEKRWREVFLLAIGMLPNAERLLQLIKRQIDLLVAGDKTIQMLLTWAKESSLSVQASYKQTAIRAFYLTRAYDLAIANTHQRNFNNTLNRSFDTDLAHALDTNLSLDLIGSARSLGDLLNEARRRVRSNHYNPEFVIQLVNGSAKASANILSLLINSEWQQTLQQLQKQLPNQNHEQQRFDEWWQAKGQSWTEKLALVVTKSSNISHNHQLNSQQEELFQQYYNANKFLWECLNSDCYVPRQIRQEIEDTFLLPIIDIEESQVILIG